MLDFIFRRGNPTNAWEREPDLALTAVLDRPSLNGVLLGARFDDLSFLGRNDDIQFGSLCYFALGLGIHRSTEGTLESFEVVLNDENDEFQRYQGRLLWRDTELDCNPSSIEQWSTVLGEPYWLDIDDEETLAFYEFPSYEIQIELAVSGTAKRIVVTNHPIMADAEQRASYRVDKPWPPQFAQ